MSDKLFSASKSRSNRPGWSVTFRHPVREDSRGKKGLKVRRGLGTSDETEADRLVEQLNELLKDERWWYSDRRADAETRFDDVVVSAFFDGMEELSPNSESRRESIISLPGKDDGYSTVLFLGTTGAGKTTLLRHLIGSDHKNDRFPSTSTSKTTTADYEIITAPGSYTAAVTFMSEREVQAHIDECLEEACLEAVQQKSENKIAAALLEHREQRFRLSYVLGDWPDSEMTEQQDDFDFDDAPEVKEEIDPSEIVPRNERERNQETLKGFVSRIKLLTREIEKKCVDSLGELVDQKSADDRAAWLELFGDEVFKHDDFSKLALDIKDEIIGRFSKIKDGELQKSPTDWPELWNIEASDRSQFLTAVRWFSSNHHQQFGRLLTPMVDGIRVKGPLFSKILDIEDDCRLVLLDGQGLGHTAESVSSVSTRITGKFSDVDMILLVDNAQQPMQAAPLALLRTVGSSGFARKLAIAFTHFDLVEGANLGSFSQKRDHVMGSVGNAIASLRDAVGAGVAGAIERQVDSHSVFLGGLDRETAELPKGFKGQLVQSVEIMQKAINPSETTDCYPKYQFTGLEVAMRDAINAFKNPWEARLGLSYHDGIAKEHWTRIKALSRRLASQWSDGYDTLRPVADFLARLQEEASKWLDQPSGWTRQPKDDEEREVALDAIREAVFQKLSVLTKNRLIDDKLDKWIEAYSFSGTGSTDKRSRLIGEIHNYAAPDIRAGIGRDAREFLGQLHGILKDAIIKSGGNIDNQQSDAAREGSGANDG